MSLVRSFSRILSDAKKEYRKKRFDPFLAADQEFGEDDFNMLAFGNNADFMKMLLKKEAMAGRIQQIYIDPPFFSKSSYEARIRLKLAEGEKVVKHKAYEDIWDEGMEEYLKMLALRLMLMKDLLSDTGTIWLHLDWHGVHYAKILMDEIFGEKHFINEIVWTYKSGGASKKHFARKHDTILVYSKTDKYYLSLPKEKSYNRDFKPYRFKGVEEFCDEIGWYTMVNMKDVWSIDMVGRTSKERNGYATQKPEALLERILKAGSREGDIVADFFAGSSTLAAQAEKTGRRWICCDNSAVAIATSLKRLYNENSRIKMLFSEKSINDPGTEVKLPEEDEAQMSFLTEESCFEFRIREKTVKIDMLGNLKAE